MADYEIKRSNRKTMGIYVTKEGNVEVRCPYGVLVKDIENFVLANRSWIDTQSAQMKEKEQQRAQFCVEPGCMLRYMGNEYPLRSIHGNKAGFDEMGFFVPENLNAQDIKANVTKIYRLLALNCLKYKVEQFSKMMNRNPATVKINASKTRWGSCSGKNSLNFSWRLIMANEGCIDYVVIHELAHTAEHNHSYRFWAIVESYMPDYKKREKDLKELQKKIAVENWDNDH